jgi:predicted N-acetyltransferase YhbS
VAHITYSHSAVTYDSEKILPTVTFGPVTVSPSRQLKGIGAKLIHYSIQNAKDMGFKAIIIMGYPSYYERFGFRCTK